DWPLANPSSTHHLGQQSRNLVEQARATLAKSLDVAPGELVFTASATESNYLALMGMWLAAQKTAPHKRRIIISPFEHASVFENAKLLVEQFDAELVFTPLTASGLVDTRQLGELLAEGNVA